jgi:D-glycero-D-manno-heptose 1,7-bisphosphate phosphatase
MARRVVFLDRDGVVNVYLHMRFVNSWDDFEFVPGALTALKRLAEAGYESVVVSNQSGVGKGLTSAAALAEITRRMTDEVARAGGRILDVLYCPHAPEDDCACRKPKPGMLVEAGRRHGFDPKDAWFVGDHDVDVQAARAAGCRSILVLTGRARADEVEAWDVKPDLVRADIAAAVEAILDGGV